MLVYLWSGLNDQTKFLEVVFRIYVPSFIGIGPTVSESCGFEYIDMDVWTYLIGFTILAISGKTTKNWIALPLPQKKLIIRNSKFIKTAII